MWVHDEFIKQKKYQVKAKWNTNSAVHSQQQVFPLCIIALKLKLLLLHYDVDSVVSDNKTEKRELSATICSINRHSVINIVEESILQD